MKAKAKNGFAALRVCPLLLLPGQTIKVHFVASSWVVAAVMKCHVLFCYAATRHPSSTKEPDWAIERARERLIFRLHCFPLVCVINGILCAMREGMRERGREIEGICAGMWMHKDCINECWGIVGSPGLIQSSVSVSVCLQDTSKGIRMLEITRAPPLPRTTTAMKPGTMRDSPPPP